MEQENGSGHNNNSIKKDPEKDIGIDKPPFTSLNSIRPPKSIHKSKSLKRKLHIPDDHMVSELERSKNRPKNR